MIINILDNGKLEKIIQIDDNSTLKVDDIIRVIQNLDKNIKIMG